MNTNTVGITEAFFHCHNRMPSAMDRWHMPRCVRAVNLVYGVAEEPVPMADSIIAYEFRAGSFHWNTDAFTFLEKCKIMDRYWVRLKY